MPGARAKSARMHSTVSFEVFKCAPQALKAGIVATAVSRRFMEFSMYVRRCIIAGAVVACSACDLILLLPPTCSRAPLLSLRWTRWTLEGRALCILTHS